jgi:hypothetical protein
MGGRGSDYAAASAGGFHTFSDMPSYGWGYPMGGAEKDAVDFFNANSNYDDLIKGMSPDELDDFNSWMSGHFMGGERWNGWDNMSKDTQDAIRNFDNVLDKSTISKGIELTRLSDAQLLFGAGKKKASLEELQAMEGKTITSAGHMSFAAAKQGLTIGDSGKNIEYKLKIPGGSKGPGMWIGDKRIGGWGAEQREFMTNRDIGIKVGKTTYNKSRGVYEVELFNDGRMPHDYGKKGKA